MKKVLIILMLIISISFTFQYANIVFGVETNDLGAGFSYDNVPKEGSSSIEKIENPIKRVWSTVIYILQIASVAGVIVMGIRYMFANSDKKADIKKGTILAVIGIIMVFAASTFVGFIIDAFNEIVM